MVQPSTLDDKSYIVPQERWLVSLGRPLDEEASQNILNRHRGRVTSGLLREIAVLPVTNLGLVEEFVFSAAFSTFDQVR